LNLTLKLGKVDISFSQKLAGACLFLFRKAGRRALLVSFQLGKQSIKSYVLTPIKRLPSAHQIAAHHASLVESVQGSKLVLYVLVQLDKIVVDFCHLFVRAFLLFNLVLSRSHVLLSLIEEWLSTRLEISSAESKWIILLNSVG
jgi:hypothetical protein